MNADETKIDRGPSAIQRRRASHFIGIMFVFASFGPLVGWLSLWLLLQVRDLVMGGDLKPDESTYPVALMFAYLLGFLPALITGLYLAWQFTKRRVSLLEATVSAAAIGVGIGLVTYYLLAKAVAANPDQFYEVLLLFLIPSAAAGLVCTRLTRRWQGPQW